MNFAFAFDKWKNYMYTKGLFETGLERWLSGWWMVPATKHTWLIPRTHTVDRNDSRSCPGLWRPTTVGTVIFMSTYLPPGDTLNVISTEEWLRQSRCEIVTQKRKKQSGFLVSFQVWIHVEVALPTWGRGADREQWEGRMCLYLSFWN